MIYLETWITGDDCGPDRKVVLGIDDVSLIALGQAIRQAEKARNLLLVGRPPEPARDETPPIMSGS